MLFKNTNAVIDIPIDSIDLNPDQPRKVFNEQDLEELSLSIKEFGVIQPILVKKVGSRYLLIAGERRLKASLLAGLNKIPAIVRNAAPKDMAFIAIVENVQREDLNYIEEALAYKCLMDEYGLSQWEIAKRVGKQQSTISNKIRILSLPQDIRDALTENKLSERHARALLRVKDDNHRQTILKRVIDNSLNVRQSEKLIDDFIKKTEEDRRKIEKLRFINYRIYVNTIRKAFSTIQDVESNAKYSQEDRGDYLELKIIIPKNGNKQIDKPAAAESSPLSQP